MKTFTKQDIDIPNIKICILTILANMTLISMTRRREYQGDK